MISLAVLKFIILIPSGTLLRPLGEVQRHAVPRVRQEKQRERNKKE